VAHAHERRLPDDRFGCRLGEHSEPQPDLARPRPRKDLYASALPAAAQVLLVIEVSQQSAAYDREVKAPRYARDGVPELWVADLDSAVVRWCSFAARRRLTATPRSPGPRRRARGRRQRCPA